MVKERKWIIKEPADPSVVSQLASELGIDPVLAGLLAQKSEPFPRPGRFSGLIWEICMTRS